MKSLMALLAAYGVLTDKGTYHARGLQDIIVEHEARLRSDIHNRIVEVSSAKAWPFMRTVTELGALNDATGENLGLLHTKYIELHETEGS